MSTTDASAHVGEPLIQVLSETVNEESMTPEMFNPPSPSPPLESANLMDGSDPPPGAVECLVTVTEFWTPHASRFMYRVKRAWKYSSYSQGALDLFLG